MVWECKRVMLTVKGDDGFPGETLWAAPRFLVHLKWEAPARI